MAPLPGTAPAAGSPAVFPPGSPRGERRSARRRVHVPVTSELPRGMGCDVVETSAEHGLRILGTLPSSGCVLARGSRWSWIVPTGSDIDVAWPAIARYLVDAAVLVPAPGPLAVTASGHRVVHRPDRPTPYTHPIMLYFAACLTAGVEPAMTLR